MRPLLLLYVISALACGTTYRPSRPELPPGDREAAELGDLAELFRTALEARRFEEAEAMLVELEEGLESADRAFILHRDYPKISGTVSDGPRALARARRSADLDGVVAVTKARADTVSELIATFETGANAEDLEALDDALDDLEEQLEEQATTRSNPRYRDVDAEARTTLIDGRSRFPRFRYQVRASEELTEVLDPVSAPLEVDTPLDERAVSADRSAEVMARCLEAAAELADSPGFAADAVLTTPLVDGPLEAVVTACQDRRTADQAGAANIRWQARFAEHYAGLSRALEAIDKAEGKAQVLAANEQATPLLEQCGEVAFADAADAETRFDGYLGQRTAPALAEICAKVAGNLVAKRPLLRWQAEYEGLRQALGDAGTAVDGAESIKDTDERKRALANAVAAMQSCDARTIALARAEEEQWSGARIDRSARRAVGRLQKRCRQVLKRAENKRDALRDGSSGD